MKILFLDDNILVLNKPAGTPVLPDGWDKDSPYLVKSLEEEVGKVFVVHRLDKWTSGIMVFARTAEAHRSLNMQFDDRRADKIYHAIMEGIPVWGEKTVKFPLRANVGKKHRTMVDDRNGKPSETRFRILKRYQAAAWVEAQPKTGRTHQVRVHAYAVGYPLLGDVLYSASPSDLIQRPALHAQSLSFDHPSTHERVTFTAEIPEDFANALKKLDV